MDAQLDDRLRIREAVENWAVWRDAGDWDRFRTLWHADGRMMATWLQGGVDAFEARRVSPTACALRIFWAARASSAPAIAPSRKPR
jgi:hypothetical protein